MSVTSGLNLSLRNDVFYDTILSICSCYVTNIIQIKSIDQNLSIVPLTDKGNITTSLAIKNNNKFIM